MDESNLHAIYWCNNREILCDGTGRHYSRLVGTDEIEPHFTTCDTWWDDCRWWQDVVEDDGSAIRCKIRKLLRQRRINREKRWIRKTLWWWKYYYDPRLVNAFICANKNCRRMFLVPGDPVVFVPEIGLCGYSSLKKWPYLSKTLLMAAWNFIWGLITVLPLDTHLFDAPWQLGYGFHYECLPEPLAELFRDKVEEIIENRYTLGSEIYSKFNEKLLAGLGQALQETIPTLREAGLKVAHAMDMRALLEPSARQKMGDLFKPIEDQLTKTLKEPIEVADIFEDIKSIRPEALMDALQSYRASEGADDEKGLMWVGGHGYWVDSSVYARLTEILLGAIRRVDGKLAHLYATLCTDFRKFVRLREIFRHEFVALFPGGRLNILELNYRLTQTPHLREDFAPLYRYLEGELKLSPWGATKIWLRF